MLVQNPSFESPSVGGGYSYTTPSGWTNPNGSPMGLSGNGGPFYSGNAISGTQALFLQSQGGVLGNCQQALLGFVPNTLTYTMSFVATSRSGYSGAVFDVLLDNYRLTQSVHPAAVGTWTQYTIFFTASLPVHTIQFSASAATGTGDNCFDAVSVVAAGEPSVNLITLPIVTGDQSTAFKSIMAQSRSLHFSASCLGGPTGFSINAGGAGSTLGDDTSGIRSMTFGVTKSIVEGKPGTPSLQLSTPGFYRFRWVVKPGTRSVSVNAKQIKTFPNQGPSSVIKKNPSVGLLTDISASVATASNWATIGPLSFPCTATGVVNVELHNNLQISSAPAYFDHIQVV